MSFNAKIGPLLLNAALSLLIGGCAYPFGGSIVVEMSPASADLEQLQLSTRNGSVEIIGESNRRDISVTVTKSARGASPDDARAHAERIDVKCERDAAHHGRLQIEATMPDPDLGRGYAADFRILTPRGAALELTTSNGRIDVRNTAGRLRAETSNGAIEVTDVSGDLDIRSSNGAIMILRSGEKSIRAITSNGPISVTAARGNADLRTSNGAITIRLVDVPDAAVDIQARSSNGRVLVEVPNDVSARLSLSTSNGGIRTDFEGVSIRDLRTGRSSVSAVLNDGNGRIDLSSSNGSLTFRTIRIQPDRG